MMTYSFMAGGLRTVCEELYLASKRYSEPARYQWNGRWVVADAAERRIYCDDPEFASDMQYFTALIPIYGDPILLQAEERLREIDAEYQAKIDRVRAEIEHRKRELLMGAKV